MIICDVTRQPGGIVGTATVELRRDGEKPVTLRLDLSEAAFDAFASGDWAAVGKLANGEKPTKATRPRSKQASALPRTREPKAEPKAASKPVPEPGAAGLEMAVAGPEVAGPETEPQTGPEATEVAIIKGEAVLDLEADVPDYDLAEQPGAKPEPEATEWRFEVGSGGGQPDAEADVPDDDLAGQPDVVPPVLDDELGGADLALVDGGSPEDDGSFDEEF